MDIAEIDYFFLICSYYLDSILDPRGGPHMVIAFVSQLVILHVRVGDRKGGRTSGNKWSYVRLRDELGHNGIYFRWSVRN